MKNYRLTFSRVLYFVLFIVTTISCSKHNETPSGAAIIGNKWYEYSATSTGCTTSTDNGTHYLFNNFDALTFNADGTITDVNGNQDNYTIKGNQLTLITTSNGTPTSEVFTFAASADTLTLTSSIDANTGCTLTIVYTKSLPNITSSIVGKWYYKDEANTGCTNTSDNGMINMFTDGETITFNSNGTVTSGSSQGIYTIKGNKLSISYSDGNTGYSDATFAVSNNGLTITQSKDSQTGCTATTTFTKSLPTWGDNSKFVGTWTFQTVNGSSTLSDGNTIGCPYSVYYDQSGNPHYNICWTIIFNSDGTYSVPPTESYAQELNGTYYVDENNIKMSSGLSDVYDEVDFGSIVSYVISGNTLTIKSSSRYFSVYNTAVLSNGPTIMGTWIQQSSTSSDCSNPSIYNGGTYTFACPATSTNACQTITFNTDGTFTTSYSTTSTTTYNSGSYSIDGNNLIRNNTDLNNPNLSYPDCTFSLSEDGGTLTLITAQPIGNDDQGYCTGTYVYKRQ